jgi:pimeloyl-ACP methyl ester carboxylesterase
MAWANPMAQLSCRTMMTVPRTDRMIEVAGRRLEAAWWGRTPAEAPTLVLLHEGLGALALWRDFPARLAAATGCGVLAWSRAGYGRSDPVTLPRPLDYMQQEAARAVRPVLDGFGVRRCILIGHSDGASIAALYSGTETDARLAGLVLLAPHFVVEEVSLSGIAAARERFLHGDLRTRLARHHDDVEGAFWGWNRAWLDPAFRAWDITAEAARITVPTLLVQGLADPYGTVAQAEIAQRLLGERLETLLLPGIGHAPHAEAAETTQAAITAFAARVLADAN